LIKIVNNINFWANAKNSLVGDDLKWYRKDNSKENNYKMEVER